MSFSMVLKQKWKIYVPQTAKIQKGWTDSRLYLWSLYTLTFNFPCLQISAKWETAIFIWTIFWSSHSAHWVTSYFKISPPSHGGTTYRKCFREIKIWKNTEAWSKKIKIIKKSLVLSYRIRFPSCHSALKYCCFLHTAGLIQANPSRFLEVSVCIFNFSEDTVVSTVHGIELKSLFLPSKHAFASTSGFLCFFFLNIFAINLRKVFFWYWMHKNLPFIF